MAGMVIEIPEQFNRVGEAVLALLARLQGSVKLTGGGKAWDYAHFEAQLQSATADIEVAGHGCMLEALDIDAPRVKIGGGSTIGLGETPRPTSLRQAPWKWCGRCTEKPVSETARQSTRWRFGRARLMTFGCPGRHGRWRI